MHNTKLRYMTRLALLMAIVIVFTLTGIGNIPVGPIVATIYHIPVIIGAVLLGTKAGCILGSVWGLLNFWLAVSGQTTDIVAVTAVSKSLFGYFLVSFLPRFLVGMAAGLLYKLVDSHFGRHQIGELLVTGIAASLVNTVGYLGLLVLIFKDVVASVYAVTPGAVLGIALGVAGSNGLVEAAVSGILTLAVCKAIQTIDNKRV